MQFISNIFSPKGNKYVDEKEVLTRNNNEEYVPVNNFNPTTKKYVDELDRINTFTEAINRENINSGEKTSIILGKIKKWFTDLKVIAFTGNWNDLQDIPNELLVSDEPSDTTEDVKLNADTLEGNSADDFFKKVDIIPISNGGTNATTIDVARENLNALRRLPYYVLSSLEYDINTEVFDSILIALSKTVESGLNTIINGSFVWIHQYFYNSFTDTSNRYQIAHGYTSNQMATRYYNDGIWSDWERIETNNTISNPNLLIDPQFHLWDNGITELSDNSGTTKVFNRYFCNAWEIITSGINLKIAKVDDGIQWTADSLSFVNIVQFIDTTKKNIKGKILTLSCQIKGLKDTTIDLVSGRSTNINVITKKESFVCNGEVQNFSMFFTADNNDIIWVNIGSRDCIDFTLYDVKLEIGNSPTIFQPQDDSVERTKSNMYYQVIGKGCWYKASATTNKLYLATPLHTYMIDNRTITPKVITDKSTTFWGMTADKNVNVNTNNISFSDKSFTYQGIPYFSVICTGSTFVSGAMYGCNDNIFEFDARIYHG